MCDKNPFDNAVPNPGRLMTFRGQRDLSLSLSGGRLVTKSRKNVVPNLNVQRNKSKFSEDSEKTSNKKRNYSHGRKKERIAPCLVQETRGVFAEWSATPDNRRYTSHEDGRRSDTVSSRSKIAQIKSLKQEEERKVNVLCSDDFVVDPDLVPDHDMKPVQLPFHSAGISLDTLTSKVKAIEESMVVDGAQEMLDRKEHARKLAEDKGREKVLDPELNERTVGDFFRDVAFHMFLLQLPEALPFKKFKSHDSPRPSTSKQSTAGTNERKCFEGCNLGSLPEGYLGKIQIRKSGKAQMVMNNVVMDLASSLQVGCREDVIAVELDSKTRTGEMINLGPLDTHFLCLPDWEQFLSRDE